MCHSREAAVWGITKLNPSHFVGPERKLYTIVKTIYKMNGEVDLHVFVSQASGQKVKESYANEVYNYSVGNTDEWQNVFKEFKETAIKRNIRKDVQGIIDDIDYKSASEIAGLATQKATNWISDTEKRYYSGEEIDNLDEEEGEPIKTGYPLYDDQIYKHGGNLKGQMKGVICREKHGKTRSECWETAQNLRMGYNVLYITLEGRKQDISGNLKQILQDEWSTHNKQIFIVDGIVDVNEIESVILEAVLMENIDKVVIDYIQLVVADGSSENERINNATERLRHLMVKYNFHLSVLSQSRKESVYTTIPKDADGNALAPKGWKHVPNISDAYGSMALIKAASVIMIGFRPALYEENIINSPLGSKVTGPDGNEYSIHSFFMKVERTRYKPERLHEWFKFLDTDNGLKGGDWV
jgi:replicative DNA helicase